MDNKEYKPVPRWTHELDMARMERANKRLFSAVILLIVLLFGSNIAWFAYESQFETVTTQEVEQDARNGENYFVGGDLNGLPENHNNENS